MKNILHMDPSSRVGLRWLAAIVTSRRQVQCLECEAKAVWVKPERPLGKFRRGFVVEAFGTANPKTSYL
jgi:hypothetical protein